MKLDSALKSRPAGQERLLLGSDCIHCSLEEGISCMVYFCIKAGQVRGSRELCRDGFRRKCPDYRKK